MMSRFLQFMLTTVLLWNVLITYFGHFVIWTAKHLIKPSRSIFFCGNTFQSALSVLSIHTAIRISKLTCNFRPSLWWRASGFFVQLLDFQLVRLIILHTHFCVTLILYSWIFLFTFSFTAIMNLCANLSTWFSFYQ